MTITQQQWQCQWHCSCHHQPFNLPQESPVKTYVHKDCQIFRHTFVFVHPDFNSISMGHCFLSDPGPIIVYACQSLTDDPVEDWTNWPKYADYADYADRAEYAKYAEYAEYAEYAKYGKFLLHTQMFSFSKYFLPFLLRSLSHKSKCHKDKSPMSSFKLADLFSPRIWSSF